MLARHPETPSGRGRRVAPSVRTAVLPELDGQPIDLVCRDAGQLGVHPISLGRHPVLRDDVTRVAQARALHGGGFLGGVGRGSYRGWCGRRKRRRNLGEGVRRTFRGHSADIAVIVRGHSADIPRTVAPRRLLAPRVARLLRLAFSLFCLFRLHHLGDDLEHPRHLLRLEVQGCELSHRSGADHSTPSSMCRTRSAIASRSRGPVPTSASARRTAATTSVLRSACPIVV